MANNNKNSTTQLISDAMLVDLAIPRDEVTPYDDVPIARSKEDLFALIQNSDESYVDYQTDTATFSLGILSSPAENVSQIYYFRHERSLVMPDYLQEEIKAVIPNAEFIDQGANRKRKDNDNITEHFHNPSYSSEAIHAEVKNAVVAQQLMLASVISVPASVSAYKATGRLGLFSAKPQAIATKDTVVSNNLPMDETPGQEADNTPKIK